MSESKIARSNERVYYYGCNVLQACAIFGSAGSSGMYWAYIMTQNAGQALTSPLGVFSFLVAMSIMGTIEGYKALQQRKNGSQQDKWFRYFVAFSIATGVATLMINAETVGDNRAKDSAIYQQAKLASEEADKNLSQYSWAKNLNIETLKQEAEAYKSQIAKRANGRSSGLTVGAVLSNPAKYPSYSHYQNGLDDIETQITAKRAYDSALESKRQALEDMGNNASGAGGNIQGYNDNFDWFINSGANLLHLAPLTFLTLFYIVTMLLMERAGMGAGKEAYIAGVHYRDGKQAAQDVQDLANLGYIPRHLNARARNLAEENARLQAQLSGAVVIEHVPEAPAPQESQKESLQARANRHAHEGSGKPELTAVMEAFEEKIKHLNNEAQERVKKALQEQAEKWTKEKAKNAYGMAYFSGINTQTPYPAPPVDSQNLGGFYASFSGGFEPLKREPKKVQDEPKRVQGSEPKKVQSEPKKVQKEVHGKPYSKSVKRGSKRKTVTPDTGTKGANANRYRALKEAVQNGEVQPTKRGIKAFKYGGRGMGDATATKYRNALIIDGIIK